MPKSHTHARGTRFHRNRAPGVLLAAALMCTAPLSVQAEPEPAPRPTAKSPSTPEPPYEQLAFFLGNWIDAEAPPERQAYPERCNWMEGGRRHVVCRTRSRTKTGEWRESLSMFSYRATDKTYLYYGLRPNGAVEFLKGRPTADGWEFEGEQGTGATRERTRVKITRLEDGSFRFWGTEARGDEPFPPGETTHYIAAPPEQ
ncbi:MAG: hypothetical protein GXC76_12110 [Rhodanobacteraceae bacterium]|jgi:hypothetical protein|nr:hypothetical protein [Rhodanobacteraceae bacterium]